MYMKENKKLFRLVFSGICLALALLLPFLTGQIPRFGQMFSPMHIPIFICGFVCGMKYGAVVGITAPLLRSLIFGMPPMLPTAVSMAAELAVYGAVSGFLSKKLPKKPFYIYVALISAMLLGRIAGGSLQQLLLSLMGDFDKVGIMLFLSSYFVETLPATVIQLIILPPAVFLLRKKRDSASQS